MNNRRHSPTLEPALVDTSSSGHKFFSFERGYSVPPAIREFLKSCHRTNLLWSASCALLDHTAILFFAVCQYWFFQKFWRLGLVSYPILLILIARFQRGLECLVHEGSHGNWYRGKRIVNDILANAIAALPVFSLVGSYRTQHMPHHSQFGSDHDGDLRRYLTLNIEAMDRSMLLRFTRDLFQRFRGYVAGWWWSFGLNRKIVLMGLLWHLLFVILPVAVLLGVAKAVFLWIALWATPFFLVLPWMRFVAEAAKHQYEGKVTIFDATISNVGIIHKMFLHPHNDGLHLIHHLFPGIPHHQMARAHRGLMEMDPDFYRSRLRYRSHVLESPRRGIS